MDVPGITECPYGNGNWRKLGTDTSDWYYYPSAGRFELRPGAFLPWDYPEGTYHTYARNGQYGKIGPASPITLTKPVPKTVYTDSNITYSVSSGNK